MSTAEYRRKKHLAYYAAHREEIIARRRARYAAKKAAMPPKLKPVRVPKPAKVKTPEEMEAYRERKRRNTEAWKARNSGRVRTPSTTPRKSRAKVAALITAPASTAPKPCEHPDAISIRDRFAAFRAAKSKI
jgi:hypothetical protein